MVHCFQNIWFNQKTLKQAPKWA